MAVTVDELIVWHNAWGPFLKGSAHLMASNVTELHAFAKRLGLKREWFQADRKHPHYDIVPSVHRKALKLGAILMTCREQVLWTRALGPTMWEG